MSAAQALPDFGPNTSETSEISEFHIYLSYGLCSKGDIFTLNPVVLYRQNETAYFFLLAIIILGETWREVFIDSRLVSNSLCKDEPELLVLLSLLP